MLLKVYVFQLEVSLHHFEGQTLDKCEAAADEVSLVPMLQY